MIILLDAGPLGMVTNPKSSAENDACNLWLETALRNGTQVVVPEIADYEVRRELLRANKVKGIERLDAMKEALGYMPLTTAAMMKAAEFWAAARNQGKPTADDKTLDGDVILAAQAALLAGSGEEVMIATTNVGHLAMFVKAQSWREIQ
jgi:predicted nucleic acid-binding protein